MTIVKLGIIHNIIAPYRIPLFEELAANEMIDLSVFYCSITEKSRKWEILTGKNYNSEILSGLIIQSSNFNLSIKPIILKKILKGNFDVIIIGGCSDFTNQMAFLMCKFVDIPIILWSEGIESTTTMLGGFFRMISRIFIKKSDAIIVPGSMSYEFHNKLGGIPNKIFLAPNSVNNLKFKQKMKILKPQKERIKRKLNLSENKIILSMSQLIERKGIRNLIDAFQIGYKNNKHYKLLIVGDGPQKGELINYCSINNISNVIFTGWVEENEKLKYYSIADVFVLPSLSDVWGLTINEAMICGLPVIATTNTGCARDMIKNEINGYIVPPEDKYALFIALNKILSDSEKIIQMGNKSIEISNENFNIQKMADGFIQSIHYVIRK